MKLLFCKSCQDIIKLTYTVRACNCGKTQGIYLPDGLHARYTGKYAIPIGIANNQFGDAIRNQPLGDKDNFIWGERFESWIIPKKCSTMIKISKKEFKKLK